MARWLFRVLMAIWCRKARIAYGGPGDKGELFNTACFQTEVSKTTGQSVGDQTAKMWLVSHGLTNDNGGRHWFRRSNGGAK